MYKLLLRLLPILLFSLPALSQQETYSKIRIYINNKTQIADLIEKGVLIDHYSKSAANSIDVEISSTEKKILDKNKVRHEILIPDIEAEYQASLGNQYRMKSGAPVCGLQNFDQGSMGFNHTYNEVIAHLDSMKSKYPALITSKINIGKSIEGNVIYAVKISDNPDSTESASEGVMHFDALHHAREPMSMESLLYYMWWLLENYNINDEATYLVNNREMHFIPVVNPDGYLYNQFTNPNGGGMWRKNRRNSGSGNFGVDLNRNYSSAWGDPLGSSSNPSSGTYHGDSAFSEPESRAVRDYFLNVEPALVFSNHAHGQKFLVSPGCFYPKEDYEGYAEFSSEFVTADFFGYGTTFEMLNYSSCGTSRHYMHDQGAYAWVPELGSSFWPPQSEFCSTVQNVIDAFKYVSFVSGSYTRLHDFSVVDSGYITASDTLHVNLRIKNRGVDLVADSVSITVQSLNSNCIGIDTVAFYASLNPRDYVSHEFTLISSSNVQVLDTILLGITIKEKDFITWTGTKKVIVGKSQVLFSDNMETGTTNWTSSSWDSTFMDSQSALYSMADSRYGNYESSDSRITTLATSIDLSGTDNPMIQFNAKWSLDEFDVVSLEVSSNGSLWTPTLTFSDHQHWTQQCVDLTSFIGQTIYVRFRLTSDNGVQSDGFYFDDFKILDFENYISSTKELDQLADIKIYPNPTSELVNISKTDIRDLKISILNSKGITIVSQSARAKLTSVDMSNYSQGIYYLKLSNNNQTRIQKLIKL